MNIRHVMKAILGLLSSVGLFAPIASSQVLEEIVVTAQRLEQNLQDVPVSVTAFSGDQLKELLSAFDFSSSSGYVQELYQPPRWVSLNLGMNF